jgi:hypothetical protein
MEIFEEFLDGGTYLASVMENLTLSMNYDETAMY